MVDIRSRRPGGMGRAAVRFDLTLPAWLSLEPLLRYLGRDPKSVSERLEGSRFTFASRVGGAPVMVEAVLAPGRVRCRLHAEGPLPPGAAAQARATLVRLLGLHLDPRPFERRVAADPRLAPLLDGDRRGLAVPQTRDLFDGLLWVVAGQQVSLPVAFALRRRLTERAGTPAGGGLYAPPTPAAVATLGIDDLRALGFSRAKAGYLLGIAAAVLDGGLDLEIDGRSPETLAETFGAIRGLGPWSVGYLLMRACGFADCVPVGDAALARKLTRFFGLDQRPDAPGVRALMAPFAPYRSLATFYLWALPDG